MPNSNKPLKLAIVCTHPIQYNAPVFRCLSNLEELRVKVFYGWEGPGKTIDHGFGHAVQWDIPLLEGYEFEFINNVAADPGSHHFKGIDLPELESKIEDWNADAVLVYGWCYKSHLNAMRHFKKRRTAVMFRGDSTLIDERPSLKTIVRRQFLRWIYRHVDIALYVGQHNRAYYEKHGLSESQLVFAPHAVDNARFEKSGIDTICIRGELGISSSDYVLLFVGKLEYKKAPDQLLRVFNKLNRKDVHLIFAGSGELRSSLMEHSRSNVHFLGFQNQSQMPNVYRAADILILPSRGPGETWGLAINEAMACGLAIIASDRVGAAIDLVQPANGWVFKSGDEQTFHDCVQTALSNDKKALRKMGDCSRHIISSWSIESQCTAIVEALQFTRLEN